MKVLLRYVFLLLLKIILVIVFLNFLQSITSCGSSAITWLTARCVRTRRASITWLTATSATTGILFNSTR
uniref:Candidate secreted effector n=1 Tax=Meloidogyne incognita TaxID=6306 RepID=A0A914N2M9_MELIC